jgi:hypothetical protein
MISTRSVNLTGTNVITTRMSAISRRTRVIFTRKVQFPSAVCDMHAQLHTSVILTRKPANMKLTSVITTHSSVIYTHRV